MYSYSTLNEDRHWMRWIKSWAYICEVWHYRSERPSCCLKERAELRNGNDSEWVFSLNPNRATRGLMYVMKSNYVRKALNSAQLWPHHRIYIIRYYTDASIDLVLIKSKWPKNAVNLLKNWHRCETSYCYVVDLLVITEIRNCVRASEQRQCLRI